MADDPLYQPGERASPWGTGREAGRCGCFATILFALPAGMLALISVGMGDCLYNVPCHQHDRRNMLIALAIVLALGSLLGLAVRSLVRWWRLRGTEAALGAWSLAWSIPVALLLGLLAIYCALAVFDMM